MTDPCDPAEARKLLDGWLAEGAAPLSESTGEFLAGSPAVSEIRRRWPRLQGACPKGCGFRGIGYASWEHYLLGDW